MMSCPRADTDFIVLTGQISYLQLGRLQHVYKSYCLWYRNGGSTKWVSFSWTTVTGYFSVDRDLFRDNVSVRLHADMQSVEIYICIDIIGEGEKCITLHPPAQIQPGETKGHGNN